MVKEVDHLVQSGLKEVLVVLSAAWAPVAT